MNTQTTNKRVNIMLSDETIQLINRVAPKGGRSRLVSKAVKFYVEKQGLAELRKSLKEGAIKNAKRDRALAEEWFKLDNDPWPE
jgi:CopG family transcriptional regulator/antitoxin EndoAI